MVNQLDIPDPDNASKVITDVKMVTSVKRQTDGSGERPFTILLEFTRGNLRAFPVVRPVDEILEMIADKGTERGKFDNVTQTENGGNSATRTVAGEIKVYNWSVRKIGGR